MTKNKIILPLLFAGLLTLSACKNGNDTKDINIYANSDIAKKVGTTYESVEKYIEDTGPLNISIDNFKHLKGTVAGDTYGADKTYRYQLDDGNLLIETMSIRLNEVITHIDLRINGESKKYIKNIEKEQRDKIEKTTEESKNNG